MKRYFGGFLLSLFILIFIAGEPSLALDLDLPIKELRTEGLKRADKKSIKFYFESKVGEKFEILLVQKEIRKLFTLGFFDDIRLDVKEDEGGLVLTYIFKEKPFVRNIVFTGIEEVKEETILARLKTKKGEFLRQDQIPWDEDRIKRTYRNKGYYFSEVRTIVTKLEQDRVDVEFIITEGKQISVGKINFRGSKAFSGGVLKGKLESSEGGLMDYFSESGAFKKDVLKADVLRLESFYHDNGYLKVRVYDPEVEIDKERRRIDITFPVSEGDQYRVGDISIEGDDVYSEEELLKKITLEKGEEFNQSQFRKDVFELTDMYSQKGYAFAAVMPRTDLKEDTKTVDVKISTKKGRKVYVGKIIISGNEDTRDRVIRREFRLSEGELFDSSKLRLTRERIARLGFFESTDIEQRSRREEDLMDIELKVIERDTGQISMAVGYSSIENLLLQSQLRWNNLLGRGQKLAFTIDYSSLRNDFSLSFTEPSLFDRRLLAGIDVFNKTFRFDAYDSKSTGGSLRVGRGMSEYWWGNLGYKYEQNEVVIRDSTTASVFLTEREGVSTTGTVFPSVTYDSRNDKFNPTTGQKLYAYLEVAGVGGNDKFVKTIGEYTYYHKLWLGFVGMFHSKIGWSEGYGGEEVPIYKRFFLGGPRSIRGFTFRDIGPMDEDGETIGGEALLQFNSELQYSFTQFFRGFLFYDRGNVYGSNDAFGNTTNDYFNLDQMRHSWGFGIHFFSPMGPVSIAYGFKLDQRANESPSEFHFTIGGAF